MGYSAGGAGWVVGAGWDAAGRWGVSWGGGIVLNKDDDVDGRAAGWVVGAVVAKSEVFSAGAVVGVAVAANCLSSASSCWSASGRRFGGGLGIFGDGRCGRGEGDRRVSRGPGLGDGLGLRELELVALDLELFGRHGLRGKAADQAGVARCGRRRGRRSVRWPGRASCRGR